MHWNSLEKKKNQSDIRHDSRHINIATSPDAEPLSLILTCRPTLSSTEYGWSCNSNLRTTHRHTDQPSSFSDIYNGYDNIENNPPFLRNFKRKNKMEIGAAPLNSSNLQKCELISRVRFLTSFVVISKHNNYYSTSACSSHDASSGAMFPLR